LKDEKERAKWEDEHLLWDFQMFLEGRYVLAEWHNEGICKVCKIRHLMDQLRPQMGGFKVRRNLPREFLGLETWEESEKKADELLKELRLNNRLESAGDKKQ
jgi:hypothetical protein